MPFSDSRNFFLIRKNLFLKCCSFSALASTFSALAGFAPGGFSSRWSGGTGLVSFVYGSLPVSLNIGVVLVVDFCRSHNVVAWYILGLGHSSLFGEPARSGTDRMRVL